MSKINLIVFAGLTLAAGGASQAAEREPGSQPILWSLNQLDSFGQQKIKVVGSPKLIDTLQGQAVEFDGRDDALFVAANPLAGLQVFTAEIVFQPYAEGPREQRFFHLQESDSENRLLFETRLTADNRWFLDTFIKSADGNYTLFAERHLHPIGPWYHAAVTVDGTTMRHYVNGSEEMSTAIKFTPQREGRASIGVRINKVFWYKGAIRQIRITPRVLTPDEFLKP